MRVWEQQGAAYFGVYGFFNDDQLTLQIMNDDQLTRQVVE